MSILGVARDEAGPPRRHGKNLVICLDGTNNQVGVSRTTNVGILFQMLSVTDPDSQRVYYDPGVGTMPASTARGKIEQFVSRIGELAFGWGVRLNVMQAYTWLMQNYQRGDRIHVFGFSRGAYTARALIGMLNRPGLLRPGSENLVEYAVRQYATNKTPSPAVKLGTQEFADAFCWGTETDPMSPGWADSNGFHWGRHAVPVAYAGLWDTVEATGLGRLGRLNWPFTHELFNVTHVRHAVSIDEHRGPFREFLVDQSETLTGHRVEEAWFAGVHSDVGGTFADHRLATIALKWIVDGTISDLILREPTSYAEACTVADDYALGTINAMSKVWAMAGTHHRVIPGEASLHASVKPRIERTAPAYSNGAHAPRRFVDDNWVDPHPGPFRIAPQRGADLGVVADAALPTIAVSPLPDGVSTTLTS